MAQSEEIRNREYPLRETDYAPIEHVGSSFDALVEARFRREEARLQYGQASPEDEERFQNTWRAFEEAHGRIIHEYWTSSAAGGVVVTELWRNMSFGETRLRFKRSRVLFHRFTGSFGRRYPDADELLFSGDALAAICEEVLRGPTQRIALTQVYTAASQLLSSLDAIAFSDRDRVEPPEPERPDGLNPAEDERWRKERDLRRAERSEERELMEEERKARLRRAEYGYKKALARADRFYRDGARQSAQFYYFKGMLVGALVVSAMVLAFTLLLPLLVKLWGLDLSEKDAAAGFAAAVAGALGACVSVMWRMTAGTFREDAIFGADNLARLGAFRPFLGSMFGLILYVALQAKVISETYIPDDPGWYFYIFLAFLAGFSERLVPDFLGDTGRGLSRREQSRVEQELATEQPLEDKPTSAPTITA
jgi:hypothetical protein